jgi:alpha-L-arabinofuranosidase
MMNLSRWIPKRALHKGSSSTKNRLFGTSSTTNSSFRPTNTSKKPWVYAYMAVGGLLMGSFGWGWKTNSNEPMEEDEAKETYWVRC